MYYCLKEDYLLRGWNKLPNGVVKRMSGSVFFLEQELYAKIRECGWMLYEGSPFLTDTQAQAMNQLVKHGVFELYEDLST